MAKYIHVDGDDGGMFVSDEQKNLKTRIDKDPWFGNGWIYKVPDDFELVIPLDKMEDHIYIYEMFDAHPDAELVFQGEQ